MKIYIDSYNGLCVDILYQCESDYYSGRNIQKMIMSKYGFSFLDICDIEKNLSFKKLSYLNENKCIDFIYIIEKEQQDFLDKLDAAIIERLLVKKFIT